MHSFAHEGSKYPLVHGVDGCLERHAEDDEAEVRQPEVQDEQVGALCVHLAVADENCEHKTVPHGTNQKYDRENDRNYYRLNFPVGEEVNPLRRVHLSYSETSKKLQRCIGTIWARIKNNYIDIFAL